jgi:cyclic dehypoxanthinyl futalosine synthase
VPRIRAGAVSYLNTRPLVFGLEQGVGADRIELSYDVPSVLASRMAAGELDLALLPTIELARIPDLVVVPGLAIGSFGDCRSVRLVTRKPLGEIRRVSLDPESRTSNALARLLFASVWGGSPTFVDGPRDLALALAEHDAAVRIGDKALFEPLPEGVIAHDLGGAWTARTSLPFVFAVWAARPGVVDRALYEALHASRRAGSAALAAIADDYTWNGRPYPEISLAYLRDSMRYRLGAPEVAAMRRFFAACAEAGIIDEASRGHSPFSFKFSVEDDAMPRVESKVLAGERITPAEALTLIEDGSLSSLGMMADAVRRRLHPDGVVTYIIDRNVNYTNVCNAFCSFCAFYRPPGHDEGYVLPFETIAQKVAETYALGGKQILLQGGHNPKLKIDYYEDLFRRLKERFPDLWLHALSAPEIVHIQKASRLTLPETLRRLREAGLDSLPGGGAEILVDDVRRRLMKNKASGSEWIAVHEEAHRAGMRSTATMMFGHVESRADRIEHLRMLRDLQDRTSGFTAFIGWTFQPGNTELGAKEATTAEYLRTMAVARIFLDNVPNIQASWVTQGPKVGAASLAFGVNDMGSTMIEENVVSSAGTVHHMNESAIVAAVIDAGFVPVRRNMLYERLGAPLHV